MSEKYRAGFHPLRFLFGYKIYKVPRRTLEGVLNICREKGISYRDVRLYEDCAVLCVPFFSSVSFVREVGRIGIEVEELRSCGIPALILRHRSRLGIPVGLLVAVLLIYLSGTVVWDIRIDGAERVSEDSVREVLAECGLSVGTRKSELDIDVIENRALIASDEISWISVNIIGTVAKVEIRELDFAPEEEPLPDVCDLVATQSGRIVGFEDIQGNISVNIGDEVSEGQVLVSGVYGDEEIGYRYTTARGTVLAEVERSFSVEVPRKYQKKSYTGEVKCEKFLVFFEKEIKFFTNSRNLYPLYDKIDTVEYLRAPNGDRLPVGIRTVRYLEYSYVEQTRSDEELARIADYRINLMIAQTGRELLRKTLRFELSDTAYTLVCDIRTVENIARVQELTPQDGESK